MKKKLTLLLSSSLLTFFIILEDKGKLGQVIYDSLDFLFGDTKIILPCVILAISLLSIKNNKDYDNELKVSVFTVFVSQGLLYLLNDLQLLEEVCFNLGYVGSVLGGSLKILFGTSISILILLLLILCAVSYFTEYNVLQYIELKRTKEVEFENTIKDVEVVRIATTKEEINDFTTESEYIESYNTYETDSKVEYKQFSNSATFSSLQGVNFSEIMNSKEFVESTKLSIPIGINEDGNIVFESVDSFPHALVVGMTGSGKSVFVNTLICSLILKNNSDELKLVMMDMKRVELASYKNLKHLLFPIVTELKKSLEVLRYLCDEMEKRYTELEETGHKNIDSYNSKSSSKMSKIVSIIDEYADLVLQSKDIEPYIQRLAQKSRACGIYLIIATQRPSVNVITGIIKANLPTRFCFSCSSSIDSKVALDDVGAEKLNGKGDLLARIPRMKSLQHIQAFWIDDSTIDTIVNKCTQEKKIEVEKTIKKTKILNAMNNFNENDLEAEEINIKDEQLFDDELTEQAFITALDDCLISTTLIRNWFNIGSDRASKIIKELYDIKLLNEQNAKNKPYSLAITTKAGFDYFKDSELKKRKKEID